MCTHGHNDHINAAAELADAVGAPIVIHPDDRMLWDVVYPTARPTARSPTATRFAAGGVELVALHTPGHSPGGVSLHDAAHTRVFSRRHAVQGRPRRDRRSFSDRDTIVESIRTRLLTLPPETVVHTGHGDDTRIADEVAALGRPAAPSDLGACSHPTGSGQAHEGRSRERGPATSVSRR